MSEDTISGCELYKMLVTNEEDANAECFSSPKVTGLTSDNIKDVYELIKKFELGYKKSQASLSYYEYFKPSLKMIHEAFAKNNLDDFIKGVESLMGDIKWE